MLGLYTDVAARLADPARCPAILQVEVGMNADAAAEMIALGADVSALVHPLSDTATPVREAGFRVTQPGVEIFGVTLALVAPGGFEQFEPARDQVKAALRGWLPAGGSMPVEYAGGQTLQYSLGKDGGRWLHLLRFRATTQDTYEAQS